MPRSYSSQKKVSGSPKAILRSRTRLCIQSSEDQATVVKPVTPRKGLRVPTKQEVGEIGDQTSGVSLRILLPRGRMGLLFQGSAPLRFPSLHATLENGWYSCAQQGAWVDTAVHSRGVHTQCLVLIGSRWLWPTGLGILLGMTLGNENLEMWTLTQDKECDLTGYLRVKLQYKNRLQYMVTGRAPKRVPVPKSQGSPGAALTSHPRYVSPNVIMTLSILVYHITKCISGSPSTGSLLLHRPLTYIHMAFSL